AFAPAALLRVRGVNGIFGRDILSRPKTAHILVHRPSGVSHCLRRFGGAPISQSQKLEAKSRATATATATAAIAVVAAAATITLAPV
ncbi:MAG: hypothetical protein ABN502_00595, partial [Gammaproteobacteria bacterium]